MRKEQIQKVLHENNIDLKTMDTIVGRCGGLPPVKSGAYKINDAMIERLRTNPTLDHASNLGAVISYSLANEIGVNSYIYDPVCVDAVSYTHLDVYKRQTTNIVDNNKNAKISYKYSDFGETREIGDTDFYNEIAYTGGIYDESTSLYYLNARYYNPEDARFITQDTYRGEVNNPSSLHLYAYCTNNPINYVDPTGHWVTSIGIAVGISVVYKYENFVGIAISCLLYTSRCV